MSPPRSRTIWAEDRLRHAIVSGELAPGERVLIEPLAQAWNLSATPLREALRTLAGEGLVVLDAQRGARIAPVSEQGLTEVYELRAGARSPSTVASTTSRAGARRTTARNSSPSTSRGPLIAFGGRALERVAERLTAHDPSLAVAGLESLAVRSGSRGRSPA